MVGLALDRLSMDHRHVVGEELVRVALDEWLVDRVALDGLPLDG